MRGSTVLVVAMAVAVFGILAMLLVDHGPWSKPHFRTALINYGTTTAAALAAGARVTPTGGEARDRTGAARTEAGATCE